MTVRRLDENGDIVTSGVQFVTKQDEIAQTIQTRLRLFLGEYFRNVTDGTAWYQSILGKESTLANKDAIIKRRITQTDGVIKLLTYSTEYDETTRDYTVTGSVSTPYGEVSFNG